VAQAPATSTQQLELGRVATSDVDHLVLAERQHEGELLLPALLVEQRVVEGLLAAVQVQPARTVVAVHLGEEVIGEVEHQTCVKAQRPTALREALRPLATAAPPSAQQRPRVVHARESGHLTNSATDIVVVAAQSGAPLFLLVDELLRTQKQSRPAR